MIGDGLIAGMLTNKFCIVCERRGKIRVGAKGSALPVYDAVVIFDSWFRNGSASPVMAGLDAEQIETAAAIRSFDDMLAPAGFQRRLSDQCLSEPNRSDRS